SRIPGAGPPLFTAYVRDITEHKRTEHRRNARLAVTEILAEAGSLREAAARILRTVCEALSWDVGGFWTLDREANVLRCLEVWHAPSIHVEEFETVSRQCLFPPGIGLPGRAWSRGKPAWIPDVTKVSNFPRAPHAVREGLHGAFGCPILLGQEFLG